MHFGSFNVRVYEAAQCSPYIIITVQLRVHQFFYDFYSAVYSTTVILSLLQCSLQHNRSFIIATVQSTAQPSLIIATELFITQLSPYHCYSAVYSTTVPFILLQCSLQHNSPLIIATVQFTAQQSPYHRNCAVYSKTVPLSLLLRSLHNIVYVNGNIHIVSL